MLKHMVETNEDDLKIATKQAFNIVMQAIAKVSIEMLIIGMHKSLVLKTNTLATWL